MPGVWNTMKTSWKSQGAFINNAPWSPKVPGTAFSRLEIPVPREGLLHSAKRNISEYMTSGLMDSHKGLMLGKNSRSHVSYGGSIFSAGGWREIMNKAEQVESSG